MEKGLSLLNSIRRVTWFFREHGLQATGIRSLATLRRARYLGRMVLFSCELPAEAADLSSRISVEQANLDTVLEADRERLIEVWNPDARKREMARRLAAGSELWLARVQGDLAGFGWTIQGRTIEPHFFPLRPDDVHLFDFFVFPEFRGCGVNVALVMEILARLSRRQIRFAHIECTRWNYAQIRSLSKTAFKVVAEVTRITLLGRAVVIWH